MSYLKVWMTWSSTMSRLHLNRCMANTGQAQGELAKKRLTIQEQANRIILYWIPQNLNSLTLNKITTHACWTTMIT